MRKKTQQIHTATKHSQTPINQRQKRLRSSWINSFPMAGEQSKWQVSREKQWTPEVRAEHFSRSAKKELLTHSLMPTDNIL